MLSNKAAILVTSCFKIGCSGEFHSPSCLHWFRRVSKTDFMCAMMSIISSMVRNELSQPFLCILIDVHRNILMPMTPLPSVFISWKKAGGKPLCNGHLFIMAIFFCPAGGLIVKSFNYTCIVLTAVSSSLSQFINIPLFTNSHRAHPIIMKKAVVRPRSWMLLNIFYFYNTFLQKSGTSSK